jgi:hypothetical protein
MSEYQYYEFVAVDKPLTSTQQQELRAISTRARIDTSSFVNDYQWGDLKADPRDLMERYFDAFLYLANWGTRRVTLRLPTTALDPDVVAAYCVGDSASWWQTRQHIFLDLDSEDEEGDFDDDGEGRLASIIPVRSELAAGDTRALYLAWLLCVQNRELDDDDVEPPVPAGLGRLTGPLKSLADFLRLDADLLAAAAGASAASDTGPPSDAALDRWVQALSEQDKTEIILRLLRGDDAHLRAGLLRDFHGPVPAAAHRSRTVGELLAAAETRWQDRQRRTARRQAAERALREEAAAAARQKRLQELAKEEPAAWSRVDTMLATTKPKEYDAAVRLLQDLQALSDSNGTSASFRTRLRELRTTHARKPSLIDRLDRAELP